MQQYSTEGTDIFFQMKLQNEKIRKLEAKVIELENKSDETGLWDNSDMIRNWNVSKRTLASWRASGSIEYIQVNGKIWYSKQNRDAFLSAHTIKAKETEICYN